MRVGPAADPRLDRLVLEAAALEGEARRSFLAALTPTDAELAQEVRRRLAAAAHLDDDFLPSPATAVLAALAEASPTAEPEPPASDERYEIGECLGVGGMARVYRAFDQQLGRPVALKLLDATDPATPRRLLAEARAQARVRHDHVLDVYETGDLAGRPYIAVRFAAGGTLAELPAEVGLEARVRLLAQAAEGLHAAHREGLLHGDVKPSNVLIEDTPDGEPRAWIGDFGIAVELTERASAGGTAGTPRYMAPELLRGGPGGDSPLAADRRADVYSLGVTLLQVVAGQPPPRSAGFAELRRSEPALPPDLVAIAARCLAEDPADRYPSARAVAEDLRRFLDGDVVAAYADRRAYRLARFAARHRALLTVAGISAVLLTAALVVAALLGLSAVRANAVAEDRRSQAEDLIDFMLDDLRGKLEPVGRLDLLDDVGDRAMGYFAAVPQSELSDEELAHRATALHQIGEVRLRRGDLAGAERSFAESLTLARELAARDPDNGERLFGLGQSEFWAGYALWERGDRAAARHHFEAYADLSERLVSLDPQRQEWWAELSYAHSNLGSVSQAQGNPAAALGHFRRSLRIDQRLAAEAAALERTADAGNATELAAETAQRHFDLALTHNTLGVVLERLGRLDDALHQYRADLDLRHGLERRDPRNRQWRERLGTSHQYLGNLLLARGELAAARGHLDAAREVFHQLHGHDPDNGDWRYKLAWSELMLGRLEHAEAHPQAAEDAWRRARRHSEALAAIDPERLDWRLLNGVTLLHQALHQATRVPGPAGRPHGGRRPPWSR